MEYLGTLNKEPASVAKTHPNVMMAGGCSDFRAVQKMNPGSTVACRGYS